VALRQLRERLVPYLARPMGRLHVARDVVKHNTGFTLLELMTALAVLAILVALAAPSFRTFTSNNHVTAVNNDLITALNLARSEATRRSVPVSICASADGATCGTAGNWSTGWIVFQNPVAPAGQIAAAGDVIQKWAASPGVVLFPATSAYIQYQPTGTVDAAGSIDVSYPGCQGLHRRHIQVSAIGTISTQLQPCP
jgi:type IV fimbrial biogenesis protein FimT